MSYIKNRNTEIISSQINILNNYNQIIRQEAKSNTRFTNNDTKRQILHVLAGISIIFLLVHNILTPFRLFLLVSLGIVLSLLSLKFEIPVVSWFLKNFARKNEIPGRGILLFGVGCILALKLFSWNIALASIAILTFLDPISNFVGSNFGRVKNPLDTRKNIEGHFAGILVSGAFSLLFVPFLYATAGAIISGIFEAVKIKIQERTLDDNLVIPLVAGTVMLLLTRWL